MENELPLINLFEKILFFLGWREIFLVEGDSMFPTLKDGDFVLINPYAEPKTGNIVLAQHPFKQSVKIVKRLKEITAEGRFFLVGDNLPESTDSRSFGAIARKDILGKVESRMN
jgi:nickel-type superoxide dismutase maturation protease